MKKIIMAAALVFSSVFLSAQEKDNGNVVRGTAESHTFEDESARYPDALFIFKLKSRVLFFVVFFESYFCQFFQLFIT